MKLLNFIKNLFRKKDLSHKELISYRGLPKNVESIKKNLKIHDQMDAAVFAYDTLIATGKVDLSTIRSTYKNNLVIKVMGLNGQIPETLKLSGILYNSETKHIEYDLYMTIDNVSFLGGNQVACQEEDILTTIVSREMV